MSDESIKDIASLKNLREDLQGVKSVAALLRIIPIIRKKDFVKKINLEIDNLENQLQELSDAPDLYNKHFCSIGWIAHESMSLGIMLSAVEFAKQSKIKEAEEVLLSYYTAESLSVFLARLKCMDAFSKRFNLIEQAIVDYKENRFSSCVLHLLVVIDGSVNDIENTGFFADKTNLSAWDSVVGHSSGLRQLKELFYQSRNRTNTDEITVPYRNGILHGRDVNFNNKYVAAKCWSALIAVYDWATALKNKGRIEPEKEKEPGLIESIKKYIDIKKQSCRTKELFEEWTPRNLVIGKNVPAWGSIDEYENKSPEQKAIEIMSYWQKGQWGKITPLLWDCLKFDVNPKKEAVKLKDMLNGEIPKPIKILKIDDQGAKITEVHILSEFSDGAQRGKRVIPLRFVYETMDGTFVVRGDEKGDWHLVKGSLLPREYCEE